MMLKTGHKGKCVRALHRVIGGHFVQVLNDSINVTVGTDNIVVPVCIWIRYFEMRMSNYFWY